jgi:hypothetical protein
MSFRLIIFAFASSMLMFSPVHGAEGQTAAASSEVPSPSAIEERIRAYRESFDKQRLQAEERHEEAVTRHQSMRSQQTPPPPPQVAARQKQLSKRQQAMKKFHEEQQAYYKKQQEEREALATRWREARQKIQEARMETYLREREERLARIEKQQELMRNRAEDQHNYLVENQDKIMQRMLEQKVEVANRHEELRKQADERRKNMAAMRAAMADMTPQEKMAYMQEHQEDVFGAPAAGQPGMHRGEGRPPMPPWARQAPRPVAPSAPPQP